MKRRKYRYSLNVDILPSRFWVSLKVWEFKSSLDQKEQISTIISEIAPGHIVQGFGLEKTNNIPILEE
jgi:hypothetical protein